MIWLPTSALPAVAATANAATKRVAAVLRFEVAWLFAFVMLEVLLLSWDC